MNLSAFNKVLIVTGIALVTLVGIFFLPPIAQPQAYHQFADSRSIWGISNFANVISNAPFVVIGLYGIVLVAKTSVVGPIQSVYCLLFLGVLLTGLGSAYYHIHPDNDTLVWDRIPMTIVFMSFLSATVAELVTQKLGTWLLVPLVVLGIGSVAWWHYSEVNGHGDLRLYFWVQFYPMLAIPLLLWLFYNPTVRAILPTLLWIVAWYVLAKVFEALDFPLYRMLGVSGHTLKHLAAAVSTVYFVKLFRIRYLSGAASSGNI